eukprot:UN01022
MLYGGHSLILGLFYRLFFLWVSFLRLNLLAMQ